jgi:hypothetical protein
VYKIHHVKLTLLLLLSGGLSGGSSTTGGSGASGSGGASRANVGEEVLDVLALESLWIEKYW